VADTGPVPIPIASVLGRIPCRRAGRRMVGCWSALGRVDSVKTLRPTQHQIDHFGDVFPIHSVGVVLMYR